MDDLARHLARLKPNERESLSLRWADRAIRTHIPAALREHGLDEEAAALEDLPELVDVAGVHRAAARVQRLSSRIPAVLTADGIAACLAASSGAPDASLRAAKAAQSASSRHETGAAPRVASPSGLPVGLRAVPDPEGDLQLEECRAILGDR